MTKLQNKDDFYQSICLTLIESAKIDNALMRADESDKRSMSLVGAKDEKPMSANNKNTSPRDNHHYQQQQ